MFALTNLWMWLDSMLFAFHSNGPWWAWLLIIGILMGVIGGAVAGLIFGINLMLTCRFADMNHNDAFSAMRLNSFRNFLRIRILGNQITVYPIGMDRVPERSEWIDNPESASNPLAAYFVSKRKLEPKLLEPAIVVGGFDVSPAAATVKKPSELPRE
jgi:hypothetical protein